MVNHGFRGLRGRLLSGFIDPDLSDSRVDSDEIAVLAAGMRAEGGGPPPNPPSEYSRQPEPVKGACGATA